MGAGQRRRKAARDRRLESLANRSVETKEEQQPKPKKATVTKTSQTTPGAKKSTVTDERSK